MKNTPSFTIYYDRKCERCGEPGAMATGLCFRCLSKAMDADEWITVTKRKTTGDSKPRIKFYDDALNDYVLVPRLDYPKESRIEETATLDPNQKQP